MLKMGQGRTTDSIVWQLPIASAENSNTDYIHGNAKPHAFVVYDDEIVNNSLCKKYSQWANEYENINIESVEATYLCKKCLCLYKKWIVEKET